MILSIGIPFFVDDPSVVRAASMRPRAAKTLARLDFSASALGRRRSAILTRNPEKRGFSSVNGHRQPQRWVVGGRLSASDAGQHRSDVSIRVLKEDLNEFLDAFGKSQAADKSQMKLYLR
jgi:hypothetical protein